ncbi:hypothetical protein SUGI_0751700 [Cryptomeria japonica]|nr:hypothetical protein SUGI_0751700 [Cryptomeria japonica]
MQEEPAMPNQSLRVINHWICITSSVALKKSIFPVIFRGVGLTEAPMKQGRHRASGIERGGKRQTDDPPFEAPTAQGSLLTTDQITQSTTLNDVFTIFKC